MRSWRVKQWKKFWENKIKHQDVWFDWFFVSKIYYEMYICLRVIFSVMRILSLLLLFVFFFSSSALVHASSMNIFSHGGQVSHMYHGIDDHGCCADHKHDEIDKTWSCIEDCLWDYDDIVSASYPLREDKVVVDIDRYQRLWEYEDTPYEDVFCGDCTRWPPTCFSPYSDYVGITVLHL